LFFLFGSEEKQNVSQGNLAGEAFLAGSIFFAQIKTIVSFKYLCIAAETSKGGRHQVCGDTIHLGDENSFVLKIKFADAPGLRIQIMLVF
jgi:hypothetical protein